MRISCFCPSLIKSFWRYSIYISLIFNSVIFGQSGIGYKNSTLSQTDSSDLFKDKKAIEQIVEQWKDGYNNGDASKVADLYTDDAYYLTQHFVTGIVKGKNAIKAYVQRGIDAHYHINSINIILLKFSNHFAYTITRYEANNVGQIAVGVNLVVLNKINGNWFIVAHEAAVPDPESSINNLDIK